MQKIQSTTERFSAEAGIAIGPILFIIAILGILAAAIAAGSGSFTAGTGGESNSTKASALIQIGENLKVGYDRVTMEAGTDVCNVVIDNNNTSAATDLFSPSGGGVSIPSKSLANDPNNDNWQYLWAEIPQLGTTAKERIAMLQVASGVCDQINSKGNALTAATNYNTGAIGDPSNAASNDLGDLTNSWPANLKSKTLGCIETTSTNTYWFYQVLAIQ